jgi:serine/threonine protein kinase
MGCTYSDRSQVKKDADADTVPRSKLDHDGGDPRSWASTSTSPEGPGLRRSDLSDAEVSKGRSPRSARSTGRRSNGQEAASRSSGLSDFKLIKTLGVGFIGSVRLVNLANGNDGTPFALKIMKKSVVLKKEQVDHVLQEKQLLSQVGHPFIVKMLASFQDDANLYMLMEYVNGGELFSAIRNGKRFKNEGAKFYAAEVTLALGHCHASCIAYRDLKLENILMDSQGHVKITDFGFAKVVRTRTYTRCGTPDYMAPEIIGMKGHDMSVDWWSMGVLIYELLTGRTPFVGSSSQATYQNVLHNEPRFPSHFTEHARGIVRQLLTKDRTRRLGCGVNGTEDVQGHEWFDIVSWDLTLEKKYVPPFVPNVKHDWDTSMFDDYPEEAVSSKDPGLSAAQQKCFEEF